MWHLLRRRNFGLLWFAGLISVVGDWALIVGLPIYVYQLTESALATSISFVAGQIPRLLLGPIAGVFVDRWDRRQTMLVANLLLALGLLPLLAIRGAGDVWIVYLVMFFQSCCATFFNPAENALLPRLVAEEHLVEANALNSLNNNLGRLIGPALGGFIAAAGGLSGIVWIDAASFLIAAGLVALITGSHRATSEEGATDSSLRRVWPELLDGFAQIRRERAVTVIFLMMTITALGEGVFAVLFIVFVNRVLGGGAQEIGWLMSAQAVGGLLGGLCVGWVGRRLSPAVMIGIGAVLFGAIDLAIFNYPAVLPGFIPALVLFVLVGIPGVGAMTGINAILQTAVADSFRGRVFAAFGALTTLAVMVGSLSAGFLGERLGVVTVLNIQGFVYIVAGALGFVLLRSLVPNKASPRQAMTDDTSLQGVTQ